MSGGFGDKLLICCYHLSCDLV